MTTLMTMSMLPRLATRLALVGLATGGSLASAAAQELPPRAQVRFQGTASSELDAGWHTGTIYSTAGDCAMVVTPDPKVHGGRRVLGLVLIQKLERQDGATWIDVPVKAVSAKEPKRCREAVGG